jgi:hypothetical protein
MRPESNNTLGVARLDANQKREAFQAVIRCDLNCFECRNVSVYEKPSQLKKEKPAKTKA